MKRLVHSALFLTLLTMLLQSAVAEVCTDQVSCEKINQLSEAVAGSLPMQLNGTMTWTTLTTDGATVNAGVALSYDRKFLEQNYAQRNLSADTAKSALENSAYAICQHQFGKEVTKLGATIIFTYRFSDDEIFHEVPVASCAIPQETHHHEKAS
jgi:hypothetical protein